jgi:putative ABC transport system permease protein
MLHAYYKIALRSLLKSRLFSLLNLSGLALGLAVSLLLALYIRDERSFDRFHKTKSVFTAWVSRPRLTGKRNNGAMRPTL